MDILYIYNGYRKSESLRYALRSIAKYGRNVGRVYLVAAEKPDWCSDEVRFIEYASNPELYKENDITAAIYHAVENSDIADRFLISGDDYFYIADTDFDRYPIYRKGVLPSATKGKESMGGWKYVQSVVNTRILLTAANLPYENYCEHAMFYGDRKLMKKYRNLFDAAAMLEYGAVYDSILGNLLAKQGKLTVVDRKDNKIDTCGTMAELKAMIGDTEVFSTTDGSMERGIRNILQAEFPEPCKYEKDNKIS